MAYGAVQGALAEDIDSANPIAADRAAIDRLDHLALSDWHGRKEIDARTWLSGTPNATASRTTIPVTPRSSKSTFRERCPESPPNELRSTESGSCVSAFKSAATSIGWSQASSSAGRPVRRRSAAATALDLTSHRPPQVALCGAQFRPRDGAPPARPAPCPAGTTATAGLGLAQQAEVVGLRAAGLAAFAQEEAFAEDEAFTEQEAAARCQPARQRLGGYERPCLTVL